MISTLKFVVIISMLLSLIACEKGIQKKEVTLDESETALAETLGFDKEILLEVKSYADAPLSQLKTVFSEYLPETKKIKKTVTKHSGIIFSTDQKKAREIILLLKESLKAKGYRIFLSEMHFGYSPDQVAIIKSNDQFDILRVKQTDAANFGLDNNAVITHLKKWHELYPFEIIGADLDWVEAEFIQQPKDMLQFAKEVYKFCPDVVDQGTETVERLAQEMKRTNTLYLWWD
jgi:hypothetical protein